MPGGGEGGILIGGSKTKAKDKDERRQQKLQFDYEKIPNGKSSLSFPFSHFSFHFGLPPTFAMRAPKHFSRIKHRNSHTHRHYIEFIRSSKNNIGIGFGNLVYWCVLILPLLLIRFVLAPKTT